MEQTYHFLESRTAPVIKRLASRCLEYTPQEKYYLTTFMAHQLTRVPRFRSVIEREIQNDFRQELCESAEDESRLRKSISDYLAANPDKKGSLTPEAVRESIARGGVRCAPTPLWVTAHAIHNALRFARVIFAAEWTFLISDGPSTFVTADQPVCLRSPGAKRLHIDTENAINPDLEITFALSPSCLLIAHQHTGWPQVRGADLAEVQNINCGMMPVADRYVFAAQRSDAALALEMRAHIEKKLRS